MQTLLIDETELLFFAGRAALLVIAFLAFAIAFGRWRRAGSRDMQALMSETRGLAERTDGLAAQLATLLEKLDERAQLAQASAAPGGGGIDLAIRLVRQGSEIEDIVKTCGVTRQEAQLLARLHGAEVQRTA
jgi:hypothetical protein